MNLGLSPLLTEKNRQRKLYSNLTAITILHKMNSGSKDWTFFGWEGISFLIPGDWDLSLVEGGGRKGYFRIDDPHMARVEVKWEKARGHFSPAKIADRYIRTLKKAAKKTDNFGVEREIKIDGAQSILRRGKGELFAVRHESLHSYCVTWNCESCNRVFLMRVLGNAGEDFEEIVRKIYGSLKDHSVRGMNTWSIYGFIFKLPEDFVLERRSLLSGRIRLTFKKKSEIRFGGQERLQIERLSLADLLLENNSLENWFGSFFKKDLRPFEYHLEEEEGLKHETLRISGVAKRKFVSPGCLGKRRLLDGFLWSCPQSNKIFLLMRTDTTADKGVLKKLYHQIQCH